MIDNITLEELDNVMEGMLKRGTPEEDYLEDSQLGDLILRSRLRAGAVPIAEGYHIPLKVAAALIALGVRIHIEIVNQNPYRNS